MTTTTPAMPTATLSTPSDREIRVERTFTAPREVVWRAMTDPSLVAQWWERGNPLVIERDEVERGGHWRYVEHTPDGQTHGFDGRTRLASVSLFHTTAERDGMLHSGMEGGMNESLSALDRLLATLR